MNIISRWQATCSVKPTIKHTNEKGEVIDKKATSISDAAAQPVEATNGKRPHDGDSADEPASKKVDTKSEVAAEAS